MEARYVFYLLVPQEVGKKVSHRLDRITNYPFTLPQAREVEAKGKSLPLHIVGWRPSGILRLPDTKVERDMIRGLSCLLSPQQPEFGHTVYLKLTPLDGLEEGIVYISGCYRTQGDARIRSYDKGQLVVAHHKGKRISLGGDKPKQYKPDIWAADDIWGLQCLGAKKKITSYSTSKR